MASDESDSSDDEELDQSALINMVPDVDISTPSSSDQINTVLTEYKDLFAKHFLKIPGIKYSSCTIKWKENSSPRGCRMLRYSPVHQEVIKNEIEKNWKVESSNHHMHFGFFQSFKPLSQMVGLDSVSIV